MKKLVQLLVLIMVIGGVFYGLSKLAYLDTKEPLGYFDLHTTYRNYIVSNKYIAHDAYFMHLTNPITKQIHKIKVRDHVYLCNYFVGDTIK